MNTDKIDTYAIDEVANGEYTRGTYVVDDEKKIVSYTLGIGAVSVAVIEKFTELANHTGYTFQTKFNDCDLVASPGMTEKQVFEQFDKNMKTKEKKEKNNKKTQKGEKNTIANFINEKFDWFKD